MERHVRLVTRTPLARTPLSRVTPLRQQAPAEVIVITGGGQVVPLRKPSRPKDTIPPRVRAAVARRDMGMCVYTGKPAEHVHHRRLRGMGGTSDPHAHCPCNLISLASGAHEWAHANRREAEAEGLIIPAATPKPWLIPVLVHSYEDGSGLWAYPSCDGEWLTYEPDSGGAA